MIFLLDTNVVSGLMREDANLTSWIATVQAEDRAVICTIIRGEILFGLEKLPLGRRRAELEAKARRFFAVLPCEPVPYRAGDLYATVKLTQQHRGLSLDENDLWIAATTMAMNAVLITRDNDFHRVSGLAVIAP